MKKKGLLRGLLRVLIILFLLGVIGMLIGVLYYSKDLPRPEEFTERRLTEPTRIYDRDGEEVLYTIFGEEKRQEVPLEDVSQYFLDAVISAEDKNFYSHFGIDPIGIARALIVDITTNSRAQGASTITQQLIRGTFLTYEKSIERKVKEIILSIELDARYSKDQILEWYVNQIPFGSNAYGIESASRIFFSKSAKDLTIAESALLSSVIPATSRLSPYGSHKVTLLEKKDRLIDTMAKEGRITKEEAEEAKAEVIEFKKVSSPIKAPSLVLMVKEELISKYGEEYLMNKGLKVYTTLDFELQKEAEKIVESGALRNKSLGAHNAALVAIEPHSGEILSYVGNKGYFDESYPEGCTPGRNCLFEPQFDVASLGERQPGSSFKPIVYSVAFENGYDDMTTVLDEETSFGIWGGEEYIPQNYDGMYRGQVTLRKALAQSLNIPAVKVLLDLAGISKSIETAEDMGISTFGPASLYGPSLVLGGGEVLLVDMVSAYSTFANGGMRYPYHSILRIEDKDGNVLEEYSPDAKRVISTRSAEMVTSVLSDNEARAPVFGVYSPLYVNDNTAVKTGTTQFYNDAWTIGYNNQVVAGVWVGNNNNEPAYQLPGVTLAGPMWNEFMVTALELMNQD